MTDATSVHGPWPEVAAVGCQRGHLGQLARREDALGLPGLPRRFSPSSESHQRDPPLVAPSRLACMDLPKVPGHQPHGSCLRLRRGQWDHRHVAAPPDHTARGSVGFLTLGNLMGGTPLQPEEGVSHGTFSASLPGPSRRAAASRSGLPGRGGERGRRRHRPDAQLGSGQRDPVRVRRRAAGPGGRPHQRRRDRGIGA
jgi:hypothetical protein